MIRHLVQVASALVCAKEETGKVIHLDIEPEPDGLIENSIEAVDFFRKYLLPIGAPLLAATLRRPVNRAERDLLEHIPPLVVALDSEQEQATATAGLLPPIAHLALLV
mgnify:CR=1 FL=1